MKPQISEKNIACIFVYYNPPSYALETVRKLVNFGYRAVVVINHADDSIINSLNKINGVRVIVNSSNLGLATGLNMGVECAFNDPDVLYVNLFDQDSLPEESLPINLACEITRNIDNKWACIGPILIDMKNTLLHYGENKHRIGKNFYITIPTSGTLIMRDVWTKVGPMLDSLFIDGIDHEWCFRARSLGYEICISGSHVMLHNMGDDFINYFGRYKPIHRSPLRHYYIIRNSIYLMSKMHIPFYWKVAEMIKTARRIPFYLIVSASSIMSFGMILRAIKDGFAMIMIKDK